jgi:hypothetical protein
MAIWIATYHDGDVAVIRSHFRDDAATVASGRNKPFDLMRMTTEVVEIPSRPPAAPVAPQESGDFGERLVVLAAQYNYGVARIDIYQISPFEPFVAPPSGANAEIAKRLGKRVNQIGFGRLYDKRDTGWAGDGPFGDNTPFLFGDFDGYLPSAPAGPNTRKPWVEGCESEGEPHD